MHDWQHLLLQLSLAVVSAIHFHRRVDAIILQVDWRHYSKHFFVREKDKVDSMFQKQCHFRDMVCSTTKKTISRVHVSPGSAETLVRRGGIANHHLIAYSLSNISAKNYQNQMMWVEVIVCYISDIFWDTVQMTKCSNVAALNCNVKWNEPMSSAFATIPTPLLPWYFKTRVNSFPWTMEFQAKLQNFPLTMEFPTFC